MIHEDKNRWIINRCLQDIQSVYGRYQGDTKRQTLTAKYLIVCLDYDISDRKQCGEAGVGIQISHKLGKMF